MRNHKQCIARFCRIPLTLVLALSPVIAESAYAAFADEEKTSLLILQSAWMSLQSVMSDYTAFTTSKYVADTNREAIGAATGATVQSIGELNDAIAVLFGVIPHIAGDVGHTQMTQMTRADRVAWAYGRLDRALGYVGFSRSQWSEVAGTYNVGNAEFQDWIRRIVMGLNAAESHLRRFNRDLAYADYHPGPPTTNGSRTVVGPHGDYDEVQWHLWRSVVYFTRAMGSLAQALRIGSPTGDYAQMGRPYMALAQVNRNAINAMYIFSAAIPTGKDRFFHVLDGIKLLTTQEHQGTPMALHFINFEWQATFWPKFGRNPAWDRAVTDAVVITSDAWKQSDHAVWMLMVFPDCSILLNPEGCGGRVVP
jgi:hypothetical protein